MFKNSQKMPPKKLRLILELILEVTNNSCYHKNGNTGVKSNASLGGRSDITLIHRKMVDQLKIKKLKRSFKLRKVFQRHFSR